MREPAECLRCRGRMQVGFIPDRGDGLIGRIPDWVEGRAQTGWLGYAKTRGRARYPIQTWRCERCGWLESYATGA